MNTSFTASLLGVLALLCPLGIGQYAAAQEAKGINIAIQPYKGFSVAQTKLVSTNLAQEFDAKVTILPATPLPKSAFYKPRSRYRAGKLLDHLDEIADGKFDKIIGLTHKDISTTNGDIYDWGVFGLGSVGGRPCVVSTFRLKARGANEKLFLQRLVRVATHEVGHTLGLLHCPDEQCNMVDAKGSILSVDKGPGKLCKRCQKLVQE